MRRVMSVAIAAAMLAGCVTQDRVSFRPTSAAQMPIYRDGRSAIVSTDSVTRVVISPKLREQGRGQRPIFVVAIQNGGSAPVNFTLATVNAELNVGGTPRPLQVISYEQLVQEERTAQITGLILGAVMIGAGAAVASGQPTYRNAVLAGSLAGAGTATMIASADRGEEAIGRFEETIMKDHTVLPGEWFGGQMHLEAPRDVPREQVANYRLVIRLDPDTHAFDIAQTPTRQAIGRRATGTATALACGPHSTKMAPEGAISACGKVGRSRLT